MARLEDLVAGDLLVDESGGYRWFAAVNRVRGGLKLVCEDGSTVATRKDIAMLLTRLHVSRPNRGRRAST